MSRHAKFPPTPCDPTQAQPLDAQVLSHAERDALIVSAVEVDGQWVILSRYGDPLWKLTGGPTNTVASSKALDFRSFPEAFRPLMKAVLYTYLRRGREGKTSPKLAGLRKLSTEARPFLRFLDKLALRSLGSVTPMVCANYVAECRAKRRTHQRIGKPLSASSLFDRLLAVEALHELSRYTDDPMPQHPWPETSAWAIASIAGDGARSKQSSRTPLIPDEVFSTLFQAASALVARGDNLLDLRDALDAIEVEHAGQERHAVLPHLNRCLQANGWSGGLKAFRKTALDLRTACYIVVASLSGCRNHELAFVEAGAVHSTEDDDGIVYNWMRSQSTKTDSGYTDWMIPDAAVEALRVIDRWARPYQAKIDAEVAVRRAANHLDPEIAEAQKHRGAVFLGATPSKFNQVRTLSSIQWCRSLNSFARGCGLHWTLATHQFRRKFANYAARSQFGDLRYLREHFKHWSMDMTLVYALNDSQEWDLYLEIQYELDDIKLGVADHWFQDQPLAGGYGQSLMAWRTMEENVPLFKDRATMVRSIAESTAIRSNGHAWCTADDNGCIGNTLEHTRCSGCSNAVIGTVHARQYRRLYEDLHDLLKCDDIGPSGQARVHRDIGRCREVLIALGYDPEGARSA